MHFRDLHEVWSIYLTTRLAMDLSVRMKPAIGQNVVNCLKQTWGIAF